MFKLVVRNILSLSVTGMLLSAFFGGAADAQGSAPAGGTLVVRIEKVAPEGIVRLGVYTQATYPDDNAAPVASADVPAVGGETVITLQNVPTGTYAIEVYQDLNSNGKVDKNFLGIPKEPYGFSRDARPFLSKPDFARVKFEVGPGQNYQSVHLQNTAAPVASN
ncbi:MAG TPA: DUF2141 domain-containing protein [Rhizomicrobium sp.]|nr:DUF2141 domain-containing protein [Rhizomicrobium sp.]